MSRVKISEKLLRQQKIPKSCIFNIWHLDNCTLEPNNSFRFPKVLNDIFQIHLNIFFQTVPVLLLFLLLLLLSSTEEKKKTICDIFMTISPGVHMMQITPFFYLPSELSPFVYFIFAFQDLPNSVPCPPPYWIMIWFVKYIFT